MMTIFILVVPDALKATADSLTSQLASVNEGPSFTVPLTPVSNPGPVTHWASMPNIVPSVAQQGLMQIVQSEPFASQATVHECITDDLRQEFEDLIALMGLQELREEGPE